MTAAQRRLWHFLDRAMDGRSVSPSFREIAEALGLASISTIASLLDGLEEQGIIRRLPSRARAIELLRRPPSEDICVIRIDRTGKSDVWLSGDVREPLSFREIRMALDHAAQAIEGAALRRREGLAS